MARLMESGALGKDEIQFDIKNTPFGRKLSYISFTEGTYPTEEGLERTQLGLFRLPRKYTAEERAQHRVFPCVLSIRPMWDGASMPFACKATPSMLEIQTEHGHVQFCFDGKDLVRIRGNGAGLRFFSKLNAGDACVSRLDGTYQLSYPMAGEFLFVPIRGRLQAQCEWDWKKVRYGDAVIDVQPDTVGEFELAVHFAESDTERCPAYKPFEACVEETRKDYEEWLAMYPPVPEKYEGVKKLAVYCIWTCEVAPMGLLKNNLITYEKTDSAFAWHSAYHAMTMTKNPDFAVQTMLSIFEYQDEYGQLPDMVDDRYVNYLATKPPCHGLAILSMLEHMGERLAREHCEALYPPLVKLCNWWTTLRDTDHDGVPQYNQGCEQGYDYSVMFARGVPVEAPDLIAYIILLEEALGRLAERIGKAEESAEWLRRSEKLLDNLLKEFWNGEKFIARMSSSHEVIEFEEIFAYAPIMLGKRLPPEVVDQIVRTLLDPEKYYTPIGFKTVPRQYFKGSPIPGIVTGTTQIKLIHGLYEAGKKELAREILTGFCDITLEKLPMYRYLEFAPPKDMDVNASILYYKDFGVCSALSCVFFLILASMLAEMP